MKSSSRILRILAGLLFVGVSAGLVALVSVYLYISPQLPSTDNLRDIQLQVPLRIYSREGELIGEFGTKRRTPVAYEDIPERVVHAFVAAEDDRFFEHPGVDYQGILRAAWHLLLTGEKEQGGSTITMQVARNFFLSRAKTYKRKIMEIFLALKIERELTKKQILELYLNKIYLGNRAYGVAAAAQVYYGKELDQLTLAEIATIAGLPKAPSTYNPIASPERASERRGYVLARMLELGYIDEQQFARAAQARVTARVHGVDVALDAGYVAEMVRSRLYARYGEELYTRGLRVYTTVDARLQLAANQALQTNLLKYTRRHGWRGAAGHVDPPSRPEALALPADWPETQAASGADERSESGDGDDDGRKAIEETAKESAQAGRDELIAEWHDRLAGLLAEYPAEGGLKPAVVLRLAEKTARLYVADAGEIDLGWEGMKWARPYKGPSTVGDEPESASEIMAVGDVVYVEPLADPGKWRLAQLPDVQGALLSLDTFDGGILALSGGFAYGLDKFNRAMQARRQPGSSFKPFLYSSALAKGFTPATIINDAPVVFESEALEATWRPQNYSGRFFGPTRMREALVHSRNLVSIRILREIGVDYAIDYISRRFGFDRAQLPDNLSLSLGTASLSPLQMARGFTVFANGGYLVEPYLIKRVESRSGEVLYEHHAPIACEGCRPQDGASTPVADGAPSMVRRDLPERVSANGGMMPNRYAPRVLDRQNAYLMNDMLRDVVKHGTGRGALVLGRDDLGGKTGTTNRYQDAWFNGFNGRVTTTAWVGFDESRTLGHGETGARAALPMWIDLMRQALEGMPETPLVQPPGMVTVRIDPETGKLAPPGAEDALFEVFREGNLPEAMPATAATDGDSGSDGQSDDGGIKQLF